MTHSATRRRIRALGLAAMLTLVGCASPGRGPATDSGADPAAARSAAIESARARLAQAPHDVDARWQLAALHLEDGDTSRARAQCDSALTLAPDHLGALSVWSKLLFETGEHETAVTRLEETRARRGDLPEALRAGLALHYDALGRWEESAREFENVATPSSAKVYHVLRSDDFLAAGDIAKQALQREPSAASHNNFGITQLYAGEPESAHAAFLRALELDPDLAGAMYNLAIVETFYFFDEAAGRDWFAAYRATGAVDDPDGLAETFAWDDTSPVGRQARR